MSRRVGVIQFPGSNCEFDVVNSLRIVCAHAEIIWHESTDISAFDAIIVPGGFAHGDYLRPGAIARFSPIMRAVESFANEGGPVVGICNGFQILTEAGLLPGALQKNAGLKFICEPSAVIVVSNDSALTRNTEIGQVLSIPINHFEGNYTCSPETLQKLISEDQIILRYQKNPNGSINDIAAICNENRNVVGLMPHPERATDELLGSIDGRVLLSSFVNG